MVHVTLPQLISPTVLKGNGGEKWPTWPWLDRGFTDFLMLTLSWDDDPTWRYHMWRMELSPTHQCSFKSNAGSRTTFVDFSVCSKAKLWTLISSASCENTRKHHEKQCISLTQSMNIHDLTASCFFFGPSPLFFSFVSCAPILVTISAPGSCLESEPKIEWWEYPVKSC